MPRINQLPVASSVAQTDVLAIDTPDKTYKVPRSVLAPAPFQVTIQPGYWSGSGSDYYFTVSASNVTENAQLYPFYDKASDALLKGPVWAIPADGSFTIHTSAIPSGTVTISVLLAGIVGEAQYQVLADVYSKSQVDSIVSQSTANLIKTGTKTGTTSSTGSLSLENSYKILSIQVERADLDVFVLVARANTGNNYAKVLNWDMTPAANKNVIIHFTYLDL